MLYDEMDLRRRLLSAARAMNERGLNQGTSGNVSVRFGDGLLITPSALPYEDMSEEDLVVLSHKGKVVGGGKPSSEWRFHCDILAKRPDVDAVLHAHSLSATALACLRREIPAFHYMVAVAGGDNIRCAPYATFGTQALSDAALEALRDRRACLLANHGLICLGRDPEDALALALEVEALSAQFCRALQIGYPRLLSEGEMAETLAAFAGYKP